MSAEKDNFNTPKETKRLGLRRSSSIVKNHSVRRKNDAAANGWRCIQSDVKINYKNLEQNVNATPTTSKCSDLQRLAVSTNCRPYRLALSKRVREKMSKKRLEFHLANELEKGGGEENDVKCVPENKAKVENVFSSREELLQLIELARKELASREEHMNKVNELQEAIGVWKAGFSLAIQDLQKKFEPPLEIETILHELHIPHEMIKYINN